MTAPINMALYRLLVQMGASEPEAEAAAQIDTSTLVTKADLRGDLAELKASLVMWFIALMCAQTGLLVAVLRWVRP